MRDWAYEQDIHLPYNPQAAELTERKKDTLKAQLRALLQTSQLHILPEAIHLLNLTTCSHTPHTRLGTKTSMPSMPMTIAVWKMRPEALVPELKAGQKQLWFCAPQPILDGEGDT